MSTLSNFQTVNFEQQLTTDTAIYASGDALVSTVLVPVVGGSTSPYGGSLRGYITQLTIIDKDALSGAFDIVILSTNKSIGAANAVVSITDPDSLSVVKVIPVTTYDVLTAAGSSVARIVLDAPIFVQADPGVTGFYIALISRDTKTYTASALYLRGAFQFDNLSL